jgi:cation transporter-like permease
MVDMRNPYQSPESASAARRGADNVRKRNPFFVRVVLAVLLLLVGGLIGSLVGFALTSLAAFMGLHVRLTYPCTIAGWCFAFYVVIHDQTDKN